MDAVEQFMQQHASEYTYCKDKMLRVRRKYCLARLQSGPLSRCCNQCAVFPSVAKEQVAIEIDCHKAGWKEFYKRMAELNDKQFEE